MLPESKKEEYLTTLRIALKDDLPIHSMVREIKRFASEGVKQSTVEELLKIIYETASLQEKEVIADVNDMVVGYCNRDLRIFPP